MKNDRWTSFKLTMT